MSAFFVGNNQISKFANFIDAEGGKLDNKNASELRSLMFEKNDGGRALAGYKGDAGDCVVRAIAIATEKPYSEVYEALTVARQWHAENHRDRVAKRIQEKGTSPRNGTARKVYEKYLTSLGWKFYPTMGFGTGCKVHLKADELPKGRIICRLSKHLVAVIDGVINDTHDPSRDGTRCVYGYYQKV